jgi:hypothetical protein
LTEAEYDEFLNSPLNTLQADHRAWHARILQEFSLITDDELSLPSRYWEKERFSLRFRLGRFTSHMRQHTIQIEKILSAISGPPNEAHRLNRLLYSALAGVNAAILGTASLALEARETLAQIIAARTAEITEALITETSH